MSIITKHFHARGLIDIY